MKGNEWMNEENIRLAARFASILHDHCFCPDADHSCHHGLPAMCFSCWLNYLHIHLSYSQDCNVNFPWKSASSLPWSEFSNSLTESRRNLSICLRKGSHSLTQCFFLHFNLNHSILASLRLFTWCSCVTFPFSLHSLHWHLLFCHSSILSTNICWILYGKDCAFKWVHNLFR